MIDSRELTGNQLPGEQRPILPVGQLDTADTPADVEPVLEDSALDGYHPDQSFVFVSDKIVHTGPVEPNADTRARTVTKLIQSTLGYETPPTYPQVMAKRAKIIGYLRGSVRHDGVNKRRLDAVPIEEAVAGVLGSLHVRNHPTSQALRQLRKDFPEDKSPENKQRNLSKFAFATLCEMVVTGLHPDEIKAYYNFRLNGLGKTFRQEQARRNVSS